MCSETILRAPGLQPSHAEYGSRAVDSEGPSFDDGNEWKKKNPKSRSYSDVASYFPTGRGSVPKSLNFSIHQSEQHRIDHYPLPLAQGPCEENVCRKVNSVENSCLVESNTAILYIDTWNSFCRRARVSARGGSNVRFNRSYDRRWIMVPQKMLRKALSSPMPQSSVPRVCDLHAYWWTRQPPHYITTRRPPSWHRQCTHLRAERPHLKDPLGRSHPRAPTGRWMWSRETKVMRR